MLDDMQIMLVGQVGGITYELLPLKKAAHDNHFSESYVRHLCDSGKLIATKWRGRWFVEKHLSELRRLPPVQDGLPDG